MSAREATTYDFKENYNNNCQADTFSPPSWATSLGMASLEESLDTAIGDGSDEAGSSPVDGMTMACDRVRSNGPWSYIKS